MTVKELIEILQLSEPDAIVLIDGKPLLETSDYMDEVELSTKIAPEHNFED